MTAPLSNIKRWLTYLWKGLVLMILTVLIAFLVLIFALNLSFVQTRVVQYVTHSLSNSLEYPISVGTVKLSWFDRLLLRNISIRDRRNNKLIEVKRLVINFDLFALFQQRIVLEEAILTGADVAFTVDKVTRRINFNDFLDAIKRLAGNSSNNSNPPVFAISSIRIDDSRFGYNDVTKDSILDRFDYYHMDFDSIRANIHAFRIHSDTLQMEVDNLQSIEKNSRIRIRNIDGFLQTTSTSLVLERLKAKIDSSYISRSLTFRFRDYADFSEFNSNVVLDAKLDSTVVNMTDLAKFAPALKIFNDVAQLSGRMKGTINKFKVDDFNLFFGKKSRLKGNVSFQGLPEWNSTKIALKLKPSELYAQDLHQYSSGFVQSTFNKMRHIAISGNFTGMPSKFNAQADVKTDIGNFETDSLYITLDTNNVANSKYQGKLTTNKLHLGTLLESPFLQTIDMQGYINGRGFTLDLAKIEVHAHIAEMGMNNYNYHNINTRGTFARRLLDGYVSIADSNVHFILTGKVDMTKGVNIFRANAAVERMHLDKIGFSNEPLNLSGLVNTNFTGLDPDEIIGSASVTHGNIEYQNRKLNIPYLAVDAGKIARNRTIKIKSNFVDVTAKGTFSFAELNRDLPFLYDQFRDIFISRFKGDLHYLSKHHNNKAWNRVRAYSLDLDLNFHKINPLAKLFVPEIYISNKADFDASFTTGLNSVFTITASADTLAWKDNFLFGFAADLIASKVIDSADVVASLNISSKRQQFGDYAATEKLSVDAVWDNGLIEMDMKMAQQNSTNKVQLAGSMEFTPQSLVLVMKPSEIDLIEKSWHFNADNRVEIIDNGKVKFEKLILSDGTGRLMLNGLLSSQNQDSVEIGIADFNIAMFGVLTQTKLEGIFDGDVVLKSAFKSPDVHGNISLTNLKVDGFSVGSIFGSSNWDFQRNMLAIDVNLQRTDVNVLAVKGFYNPADKVHPFDLMAHIEKSSLVLMEPIMKGIFSEWGGTASGELSIKGSFAKPVVKGDLFVNQGKFKYNYLGTVYTFNDKITFKENEISAHNVLLTDVNRNQAKIQQAILYHLWFTNFSIDMAATLNKFQILNTDEKQNTLYYGKALATGQLTLLGNFNDLKINADFKTERGTKLSIPLDNAANAQEKKSFITYFDANNQKQVNLKDSLQGKVDLSGVSLDFNIEITPEAECEIILNRRTGDLISGKGHGNLKIGLDTRGDFTMLGQYVFDAGIYNFTFGNVANKKFNINSGSTLTWSGSPLNGIININATYEMQVSLKALVNTTDSATLARPEFNRKYPAQVNLGITGDLLHPQIQYGLKIKDGYPTSLSQEVTAFESRLALNEQERSLQLFSLFVFGTLYNSDQGFGRGSGSSNLALSSGASGLSEILSNQISSLLSTGNLQFNVNLNGLDRDALNGLNFGVGYQKGRFRISRNGSFTNLANQATAQSIVGDWNVEFYLTQNGVFRLKMSYRNNVNVTSLSNLNNSSTTFSVLHTQSFNTLRELFRRRKPVYIAPIQTVAADTFKVAPAAGPPKNKEDKPETKP